MLYSEDSKGGGGFLTGFLIGGAIFGTLGYVFAPQVLLNFILHCACTGNPSKRIYNLFCLALLQKAKRNPHQAISS
jgi:hypothetical protein